jgi:hypothetical protein
MRSIIPRLVPAALLATVPLLLMPLAAAAQEVHAQECTATLQPAEIEAGQAAVRLDAELTSDIGFVTGVEAPENSGVFLASDEELARVRVEMALPEEEGGKVEPIVMADDGRIATLWLTTAEARPGTYDVKLTGEDSQYCIAKVTVTPAGEGDGY